MTRTTSAVVVVGATPSELTKRDAPPVEFLTMTLALGTTFGAIGKMDVVVFKRAPSTWC